MLLVVIIIIIIIMIIIIIIIMSLCPVQCLSKVVFFLHFFLFFLNAALCKLNYLQVIRIFSKVSLTYSFSCLFCIFFRFLL